VSASFSRSTVRGLVAVACASMVATGLLALYGPDVFETSSAGTDAYSRSAVGHHAALQTLRRLGLQVQQSRHSTSARATDVVVMVAEPALDDDGPRSAALESILERAPAVLLVLPKRTGVPQDARPGWLAASRLRPLAEARAVLRTADPAGEVVRPAAGTFTWSSALPAWSSALPVPSLDAPQLMSTPGLVPLLATGAGALVAERRDGEHHLVVLADPDVLATHGLGRGDNAILLVRILERLGGGPRVVLVDETLHGHELQPSLGRELLRFPLVLATFQGLFTAALLAWAAWVRFGRPRAAAPPEATGATTLVASAGALLAHAGHAGASVAAYWRAAQEQLAHDLRPPGERGGVEAWIRRHAAARDRAHELEELSARVAALEPRARAHEALRLAADIHRWREEMSDGRCSHT